MSEAFDYLIVGAGSAGCVLANRLSADPSVTVALIEAGREERFFWRDVPLGVPYLLGNPRFDWSYRSLPEPGLGGRSLRLPRGRTLGGTSVINGMLYVRGHAADYDAWRDAGNRGWGWDDVLPYFLRSEDSHRGPGPLHGAGGGLSVSDPGERWPALDAWREAAAACGLPPLADYNDGSGRPGSAYCEMTIRRGRRCSAAQAFLVPASRRPNLHLLTGTMAERVRFEGRRAAGVTCRRAGGTVELTARREVILAAGAYASPALLQRSGIGPAALLAGFGIPVVADLPGVGENLQDHWMVRSRFRLRDARTLNAWVLNPLGKAAIGLRYLATRRGPMSAPPLLVTMWGRSGPEVAAADLRIHVSIASYARVGGPIDPFPGITASACICRPRSRGHVRIASAAADAPPAIVHNYLAAQADGRIAVAGLRLVRRIAAAAPMARHAPAAVEAHGDSDAELLAAARATATTEFHPAGTCAMGHGPAAVVDDRLRVHGVAALRVVDASVMPTLISGGTNAPTIMIAEKAADMIRQDRIHQDRIHQDRIHQDRSA
jgi:choline dehydrogenase